jgi:fructosamine-3-kinase
MRDTLWTDIADNISAATGSAFAPRTQRTVGGGCINTTTVIDDGQRSFFVKLNDAGRLAMFEAESAGLGELAASATLRVPAPVCTGSSGAQAYLVMEHIEFGAGNDRGAQRLGQQLAAMHRTTRERYGWQRDNTIGATPQINREETDWVVFWQQHRLGYQIELAANNGYRGDLLRKGERLLADVDVFFRSYSPPASLLHGDLWSGNYAMDRAGNPVIFDPAVYYGDREADLAMTELFGGFPADFHHEYRNAWPLDPGYSVRKHLYNLYHVLNHLNLFGGGYRSQAEDMIGRLLSEMG